MTDFADRELHTERLLLRHYREDDLDRLAEIQALPEVARYLYLGPRSREEAEEALAKRIAEIRLVEDDDAVTFAVERREDGLLLGDVSLFLRSAESRQIEIGYVFHPDAGGRGYATEAARAAIDLAFDEVDAHRVYACLDARNDASAALARRLGMRQEAHLREAEMFKGDWSDELIFAVLAAEWSSRP